MVGVIVAALVAAMLGLASLWRKSNTPEVVALVKVTPVSPQVASIMKNNRIAGGVCDFGECEVNELAQIHSPFIILSALGDPLAQRLSIVNNNHNPTRWVYDQIKVEPLEDPGVARVALRTAGGSRPLSQGSP